MTLFAGGVAMYEQLRHRLAELLRRPRALPPQADRQLQHHLAEHSSSTRDFLLCAADVLEEYELDILFGPVFTPTLDERAELSDLLFHWRPMAEQLRQLVTDICHDLPHALIKLPDGTQASLSIHEVMMDRFVRLLRLEHGPDPAIAASLRDALATELWPIGIALLCEHGMTPNHQKWFVTFVNHMRAHRPVTRELLQTTAEFIASQKSLDRTTLTEAAEALMRATEGTAAYASSGHTYWSPDVAQHHHYRGQGRIDKDLVEQRQAEVQRVAAMVEDLKSFEG
jgi:hypothetical protein